MPRTGQGAAAKKRWSGGTQPSYKDAAGGGPANTLGENHEQARSAKRGLQMKGYRMTQVSVAALLLTGLLAVSTGEARAQSLPDLLEACKNEGAAAAARMTACGRVIQGNDEDLRGEALVQRGVLYEQAGNKEAAIKDYSEAIKLDPSNAIAFFNRGNAYDQSGDYDKAIADYSEAIKLEPNDADAYNNRGQAYDNKGEFDLAIADYTAAIRIDKEDSRAYYNRGLTRTNKGEFDKAIADFDQAIKLSPRDADAYAGRASAYEELGNDAAAKADYRRALQIEPDHEDAKEGLERLQE